MLLSCLNNYRAVFCLLIFTNLFYLLISNKYGSYSQALLRSSTVTLPSSKFYFESGIGSFKQQLSNGSLHKFAQTSFSARIQFIILPRLNCSLRSVQVVILVKSFVLDFDFRKVVRQTWGREANALHFPILFFVGLPSFHVEHRSKVMATIEKESNTYGDIVLANFEDQYRNLTLKTLSLMQWAAEFCSGARAFFQTDVDSLVFPHNLGSFVVEMFLNGNLNNLMAGQCLAGYAPIRYSDNKNFVSVEAWPVETWPVFCFGVGYLMSGDVPLKLLRQVPSLDWLQQLGNVDDVVFSGILAEKAGVERVFVTGFYRWPISHVGKCNSEIIVAAEYRPSYVLRRAWRRFSSYKNCTEDTASIRDIRIAMV